MARLFRVPRATHAQLSLNFQHKLAQAPSVTDLEPVAAENVPQTGRESSLCGQCGKTAKPSDLFALQEYWKWGLCHRCQNEVFTTPLQSCFQETITFKNEVSDFQEFSLPAELCFEVHGRLWNSLGEFIEVKQQELTARHWNEQKLELVRGACAAKVLQHPRLCQLLQTTAPRDLLYYDAQDRYWAIGFNGAGLNKLGEVLKGIRDSLLE